jgi:hypothetical protein
MATRRDGSLNLRRKASYFSLSCSHLFLAAFLAISDRCSGVSFCIRPWALFFPPRLPNVTAAGFFLFAIGLHSIECSSGIAISIDMLKRFGI